MSLPVIERTMAERLHDSYIIQSEIEDEINEAFVKYEPEVAETLDFSIGSDDYDNSIEIYIKNSIPYPYEPCHEIRKIIYDMGFNIVYWNFLADVSDVICDRIMGKEPHVYKNSPDEIRGYEPRHSKYAHWVHTEYGYVDERFNKDEWVKKYKK